MSEFWTSAIDNDLNTCKIFIAVTAKVTFSDIRVVDEVPPPHPKSLTPITKSEQEAKMDITEYWMVFGQRIQPVL